MYVDRLSHWIILGSSLVKIGTRTCCCLESGIKTCIIMCSGYCLRSVIWVPAIGSYRIKSGKGQVIIGHQNGCVIDHKVVQIGSGINGSNQKGSNVRAVKYLTKILPKDSIRSKHHVNQDRSVIRVNVGQSNCG